MSVAYEVLNSTVLQQDRWQLCRDKFSVVLRRIKFLEGFCDCPELLWGGSWGGVVGQWVRVGPRMLS